MRLSKFALLALCLIVLSCGDNSPKSSPKESVSKLLELHGLKGRLPEDRTEDEKNRAVDKKALEPLIADLDANDPFITDLYVGFVVSVLARSQDNLVVSTKDDQATVKAGTLRVKMVLVENRWKILLEETIPEKIKAKAREEKARVEKKK